MDCQYFDRNRYQNMCVPLGLIVQLQGQVPSRRYIFYLARRSVEPREASSKLILRPSLFEFISKSKERIPAHGPHAAPLPLIQLDPSTYT
jgi:hypothetical protein